MTGTDGAPTAPGALPSLPLLEFSGVAHRFGRRWVLRGVDLVVHPGEVVALGGANGAGKTTLLRIAATLMRPSRGEFRTAGVDPVRDGDLARSRIGFMGHSPALYEDLTARENLAFSFRMRGGSAEPGRVEALLDQVGLLEHAGERVRKFSAGMRRRLALARVLGGSPALLLMDEPYASLDVEGVALVNRVVERVAGGGGAVVMATHDFSAGAVVTTRVVTLRDGRLERSDPQ